MLINSISFFTWNISYSSGDNALILCLGSLTLPFLKDSFVGTGFFFLIHSNVPGFFKKYDHIFPPSSFQPLPCLSPLALKFMFFLCWYYTYIYVCVYTCTYICKYNMLSLISVASVPMILGMRIWYWVTLPNVILRND